MLSLRRVWTLQEGLPEKARTREKANSASRTLWKVVVGSPRLPAFDRGSVSIESHVYISDFPVRTLFDSGASHSFISDLVESLHLSTSLVEVPLVFQIQLGVPPIYL